MSWDDDTTPDAAEHATVYASVEAFVTDFLAPTYRRPLGHARLWCPEWHRHPEAVHRLTALWEAFEHLHTKPLGCSTWWLHHAEPTMTALLDPDGPFRYCDGGTATGSTRSPSMGSVAAPRTSTGALWRRSPRSSSRRCCSPSSSPASTPARAARWPTSPPTISRSTAPPAPATGSTGPSLPRSGSSRPTTAAAPRRACSPA